MIRALLLIRPASFGFNTETAVTNTFQQNTGYPVSKQALQEFDAFAERLSAAGIPLEIIPDTVSPARPDAIFPNNWFSTHPGGLLILYPMCTPNRRTERRADIVETLKTKYGYSRVLDLSTYENTGKFLEGTGSIVFDHEQKIAYAALSPRTDHDVLNDVCTATGYTPFTFSTIDRHGLPIYHTNVVMALHPKLAVICLDCVAAADREKLRESLLAGGKQLLEISRDQLEQFAGNLLFVKTRNDTDAVILSRAAWHSLDASQKELLQSVAEPVYADLSTIETTGGGSARCMVAELF
jgi:hypothetical protein